MKKTFLILSLLFAMGLVFAQTYLLQEGFSTTSLPTGWSGDVYFNASANIGNLTGANGAGFNANNKYLQLPSLNNVGTLTFWMKGSAASSQISIKVQKSVGGGAFADIANFPKPHTATAVQKTVPVNDASSNIVLKFVAYDRTGNSIYLDDVEVTQMSATPNIIVGTSALSDFTYEYDNGPSAEKSFTLTGSNLTAAISVSVTSNYAIASTSGGTFGSSLSFTPSSGSVSATVYVIQVADLAIGSSYTGTITCSSSGATNQTVSLSGVVTSPPAPDVPVAADASGVGANSFTANWEAVDGATGYYLDVYSCTSGTLATDLFISEYIEGSASNKYIEIFNGTGSSVDLSDYKLQLYSNADATPTNDITLSGSLASGECVVYKNSSASLTLPTGVTAINNASVNFNGNDAVALYKISTSSFVDIFGNISENPTGQWGTSPLWTINTTLVRKSSVTGGVTTDPASGFPTLSTEWDNYAQDTASYLGSHTMTGGSVCTNVTGYDDLDVGNVTTYQVTDLAANTTYHYVVRAYNTYGTSANSNVKDVTTDEDVNPVELSSFTATISAENYITLTWVTQTETAMQGYYVFRASSNQISGAQIVSPMIAATNSSQQQTYAFTDTDISESGIYYYWLQTNDLDGTVNFHGPVSVFYNAIGDNPTPEIPLVTELKSVYPNPFNPLAFIPFSLAKDSTVSFKIYNTRGQIVKNFDLGSKAAGNHRISWDGTDYNGQTLANGVYYIMMNAGTQAYQTKAVLLK